MTLEYVRFNHKFSIVWIKKAENGTKPKFYSTFCFSVLFHTLQWPSANTFISIVIICVTIWRPAISPIGRLPLHSSHLCPMSSDELLLFLFRPPEGASLQPRHQLAKVQGGGGQLLPEHSRLSGLPSRGHCTAVLTSGGRRTFGG